jgi:hypothetical protein
MGMQLNPTSEMGEIQTEIRSKSAYIYSGGEFSAEDGVIDIDFPDIPKLRAALDQIESHVKK